MKALDGFTRAINQAIANSSRVTAQIKLRENNPFAWINR